MFYTKTICICGGGSLGHAIIASISSKGFKVNLLTGHPHQWEKNIVVKDCYGKEIIGELNKVSSKPEEVIPQADIILLCLPGYLIEQTIRRIAPVLQRGQSIGSVVCSNGFFWIAQKILDKRFPLFGFQRVPFICRVIEYGKKAEIKGYKSQLKIAGINHSSLDQLAIFFSSVFETQTIKIPHFLEVTLTNSNPILHTARIYSILASTETDIYEQNILFYEDWNDFSSAILIECDNEFMEIIHKLPINQKEISPLLTYYESTSAPSLTKKIRSINAFKGIKMSMKQTDSGFLIDYNNRYFSEDIPFGLLIIKSLALLTNTATPTIDKVIMLIQMRMGKEYLKDTGLTGRDIKESGIPQNFGITNIHQLLNFE